MLLFFFSSPPFFLSDFPGPPWQVLGTPMDSPPTTDTPSEALEELPKVAKEVVPFSKELVIAARRGDLETIQSKPDIPYLERHHLLWIASKHGHLPIVTLFLKNGSVYSENKKYIKAIYSSLKMEHWEIGFQLIGATYNFKELIGLCHTFAFEERADVLSQIFGKLKE